MAKSNSAIFLTALRALQHTLRAADYQITVVLDAANRESDAVVAGPRKKGECPHPIGNRISKAGMGHPNRFHCTACNTDIEE